MKILLIVLQFPPDVNSTGVLMSDIADGLTEHGHEVSVVTTFPHYRNFRTEPEYRGRWYGRETERGIDVLRLRSYAPGKKTMIRRLINYLSFAGTATLGGLFWRKSWDVILCTNGSFFSGIAAWLIGLTKRAPFIYNIQDLYPEVPIAAGQLKNRYAIGMLRAIESFMYRRAAKITVISPAMVGNLLPKRVPRTKIALIPNFVDTEYIKPLPRQNSFSSDHGWNDKFLVMHAGNLGHVYDFASLLSAAKQLEGKRDIHFVIVGEGVAKPELARQIKKLSLANVELLPYQPREVLPWLRASADVQLALYRRRAASHSLPSKLYEIMASGRPVVASADSGSPVQAHIRTTASGLWVEAEDESTLVNAILRLFNDRQLCAELGRNGRKQAEKYFCRAVAVREYQELMKEMVNDRQRTDRAFNKSTRSARAKV